MSHKSTFRFVLALFIALVMLVGMQAAAPAYAATITVDEFDSTYDDATPCSTITISDLDGGDTSLREAICAANNDGGPNDIVLTGNVLLDTVDTFDTTAYTSGQVGLPSVKSDITILGNGYTIARDTSLDGNGGATFRIFHVTSGNSLTLNDVSVNYGMSDESSWGGGGVYMQRDSFLTLTNGAHVDYNVVYNDPGRLVDRAVGGGIYGTQNSTIVIEEGSTVNNNAVYLAPSHTLECYGGGIMIAPDSTLTIDDSEVNDNYCGSAINLVGVVADIHTAYGGGIGSNGGDVTIQNESHVDNNEAYAYNSSAYGGGIYSFNAGTVQILDNSTVDDNSAEAYIGNGGEGAFVYGGGIAIVENGDLTIDESQVLWNVAYTEEGQGFGGGIFSNGSSVEVTDSQISYNSFYEAPEEPLRPVASYNAQPGFYSYNFGGGAFVYLSLVTFKHSEVSYNWATDLGGGIFTGNSSTTVDAGSQVICNLAGYMPQLDNPPDCEFPFQEIREPELRRPVAQANHYLAAGGGIFNSGGIEPRRVAQGPQPGLFVTHSSAVDRNIAAAYGEAYGGGIANGLFGDGLYLVPILAGYAEVDLSTVNGNVAYTPQNINTSYGGGLFNAPGGTMELNQTTVDGNTAYNGNGGGAANVGDLRVGYSTFSNNWASSESGLYDGNGGGLFNEEYNGNYLGLLNSTISGNVADNAGGGVYNGGGIQIGREVRQPAEPIRAEVELFNVTVTDNAAYGEAIPFRTAHSQVVPPVGGGLHDETNIDTIALWNTIVAHQASGWDCWGDVVSNGYNLDSDDTCNLTNTGDRPNSNAQLNPLADYGGPTFTHALKLNSPAIDNADPAGCYDPRDSGTLSDDQRGRHRPADGDGDGDAVCDIGAFEIQPPGEGEPDFTINVTAISITGSLIDWTVEVCNVGDAPAWSANVRIDVEDNQDPVSTDPVGTLSDHTFWVLLDLQPDECKTIGVVTEINESAGLTTDGAFAKLNDAHAKAERRQTADGPYCLDGSVADVADRDCISQTTLFPATLPETGGQPVGARGGLLLAIVSAAVLSLMAGALLLFRKRLA